MIKLGIAVTDYEEPTRVIIEDILSDWTTSDISSVDTSFFEELLANSRNPKSIIGFTEEFINLTEPKKKLKSLFEVLKEEGGPLTKVSALLSSTSGGDIKELQDFDEQVIPS